MLKILSLDGGPGPLMELRVIDHLESMFSGHEGLGSFLEQADVFAGTSDGGLMALYFAKSLTESAADREAGRTPRTSSEIILGCKSFSDAYSAALAAQTRHLAALLEPFGALRELAVELASTPDLRQQIVMDRLKTIAGFPGNLAGAFGDLWSMRKTLLGHEPLAQSAVFEGHLRGAFGDWTLRDLKKYVVVLTFDTTAWKPRAYRNFGAEDDHGKRDRERDIGLPLVEVGMSTAAMPLFLPVYGGTGNRGYLDGIFSANNPSASAVTLALRHLVDPAKGNPLEQIVALSMGASQTTEEANIEHTGGVGALLDLLAVRDRVTRMFHSVKAGDSRAYLSDKGTRASVHARPRRKGVGSMSWGWREYVRRPTFIVNMLIHGMNGESSAQAGRLLRGNFYRHAPRIHLARALFRTVFMGTPVDDTDLPRHAALCFRSNVHDADAATWSGDEEANARETDGLIEWLRRKWFPPSVDDPSAPREPEGYVL